MKNLSGRWLPTKEPYPLVVLVGEGTEPDAILAEVDLAIINIERGKRGEDYTDRICMVSQAEGDLCGDMRTCIIENERISLLLSPTYTTVTPSQRCPSTKPQKVLHARAIVLSRQGPPFCDNLGFLAISSALSPPSSSRGS